MTRIIYKTRPKLFILIIPILGAIFFGLLFWLTWTSSKNKLDVITLPFLILFFSFSVLAFIYSFNIKTVRITAENIIITHIFLPIKQTLTFTDLERITQETKDISAVLSHSWTTTLIYTSSITTFCFKNNKQIELRSIGKSDFEELNKAFKRQKTHEGKIKRNKQSHFDYILDNLDGLTWGILFLVLTIGLAHELFTK
jgi:hypothetical protein